ncbi:MAG: glycosyltransferase family 39 protein [Acidobacteria bacterium]|nr:glycosyltransferase family 39 protein [Acidobacteriota bacterium]
MKRPGVALALLAAFLLAARLCHSGLIWVEEAYPAAAAIQLLNGKLLYRDFWFDKPPLAPLIYLLWGARDGVVLRIAGAAFAFACCWVAWRLARELWSEREGLAAAGLTGFFLTFDTPSAALALAPDLLMLLPHLAAVWLARRGQPLAAGAMAGAAMLLNPKGAIVAAVCLLWIRRRDWLSLALGFAAVHGAGLAALWTSGAVGAYWRQVWVWGAVYSRDSFVDQPLLEGLRRTAAWAGFHAAIVIAAAWFWLGERSSESRRLALWTVAALAGVVLGWRFFPRYYFILLPPVAIAASRGFTRMPRPAALAVAALLAIPLARFGPRYATLAVDLLRHREPQWSDVAMAQDSAEASRLITRLRQPGDTLLVWGYRPDIFMRTRMPVGAPFLDSQPLTGVIADRHLTRSDASAPQLAAANRRSLAATRPTFVVDGLGLFNPELAIGRYADLQPWFARYYECGRTRNSVVYRLR